MTTTTTGGAYDVHAALSNPRTRKPVLRRLQEVLEWAKFSLNELAPTPVHHDKLQAVFGSRGNPLSKYLREQLLVRDGAYAVGAHSYGYRLNRAGFKRLSDLVKGSTVEATNPVIKGHEAELRSLTFQYTDQSDRLWHPLQNIRRGAKQEFWQEFGLPHAYDVEACAPTILIQLAGRFGLNIKHLTTVNAYLADRKALRQHVAEVGGMTESDAKRLINALFNGAVLAANPRRMAYALVGYDRDAIKRLQEDPTVSALRRNVKHIWNMIELEEQARTRQKVAFTDDGALIQGAEKVSLRSGKAKWSLYFRYERQVLNAIRAYLEARSNRCFTEHDGFRTEKPVDTTELEAWILDKTGFKLSIREE